MEIRGEPPFRLKPIPLLVTTALGIVTAIDITTGGKRTKKCKLR